MDNKFYVIDDEGKELEMQILFTFENEGSNYVLYFDPKTDSGDVFASKFDEDNRLIPIEEDSEWDMVEEVLGAFEDEQEEN